MAPTAVVPVAGEPGRNKRRVRAALGLVAIALLAAAAALVIRGASGGQDNAGQAPRTTPVTAPSQAPVPSQAPSTSQAPPPSTTPSQTPSTQQSSPTATPQAPTAAISDYYALLPGSLTAGYARLSDQFKQGRNLTLANYEGFWRQYQSVSVSGVTQQGADRVSADVTYVTTAGSTIVEHDTFTLVQQNGQWLIDSQTVG
jgi:hypothetical protein